MERVMERKEKMIIIEEKKKEIEMEKIDMLKEMVQGLKGKVIMVSNDRDFIERKVNQVIEKEGEGRWMEYEGGYEDMMEKRKEKELERRNVKNEEKSDGEDKGGEVEKKKRDEKRKI